MQRGQPKHLHHSCICMGSRPSDVLTQHLPACAASVSYVQHQDCILCIVVCQLSCSRWQQCANSLVVRTQVGLIMWGTQPALTTEMNRLFRIQYPFINDAEFFPPILVRPVGRQSHCRLR